jgi:hypothetical protein
MTRTLGVRARELLGDLPGLIAASVVDDDDLEVGRESADRFLRLDHEAGYGARVVIRREEHAETGGARHGANRHEGHKP